ncbi:hypothetical protein A0H76_194 [Hepatospora eriocheir]|uniref:ISXO2-like transposase domain-containing protein n=1 Tax=Hepatospora eriocheir TaxID=1081669 RepID=A0A1X0QEK6_9MICR|nr:hypothetical protein A0H76_194 [Hepatospora eriocheir]
MFVLDKRDSVALLPLTFECVVKQSIIILNGYKAYHILNSHFNKHNVINYSENFTNLTTMCHIQLIEYI